MIEYFRKDIEKVKPLDDVELHLLLYVAKYGAEKWKKYARKKIIESILPVIISKTKDYFEHDFYVNDLDLQQEVVLAVLEKAFDNFNVEEQEPGKCSLFFKYLGYYLLIAYDRLKKKYKIRFTEDEIDYEPSYLDGDWQYNILEEQFCRNFLAEKGIIEQLALATKERKLLKIRKEVEEEILKWMK